VAPLEEAARHTDPPLGRRLRRAIHHGRDECRLGGQVAQGTAIYLGQTPDMFKPLLASSVSSGTGLSDDETRLTFWGVARFVDAFAKQRGVPTSIPCTVGESATITGRSSVHDRRGIHPQPGMESGNVWFEALRHSTDGKLHVPVGGDVLVYRSMAASGSFARSQRLTSIHSHRSRERRVEWPVEGARCGSASGTSPEGVLLADATGAGPRSGEAPPRPAMTASLFPSASIQCASICPRLQTRVHPTAAT